MQHLIVSKVRAPDEKIADLYAAIVLKVANIQVVWFPDSHFGENVARTRNILWSLDRCY